MVFYPQSILDEIRNRISIVSYIGEYIPLKKAGRNHKGVCPFHSEKTPSFMVSDEKEIFHCFGCGEGGNIFSFVMKYEGVSFPEAVEQLASKAGVELPKRELSRGQLDQLETAARRRKFLFRVNQLAADFFRSNLLDQEKGDSTRNYLNSRGILNEISTQHFLGYADDSWDALCGYLKNKNVPIQLAQELGLVKQKSGSSECYDFFRGRLIFPIVSHRSEIIGFGGRILVEGDSGDNAKYLNSPDSLIYHKSYSVYGLNVAAREIRLQDKVIIVEGYMDVLALNQAGIFNVVAPLGTALTTSHIKLLSRYTKNMTLIFDGDSAGAGAAERSLPSFMEVGLMPKTVQLPAGSDPDDWIKEHSKEEFGQLAEDADSLFAWYIKKRAVSCGTDISRKSNLIAELVPFFENVKSSFEFMSYRKLLADVIKTDENDLVKQLEYSGQSKRTLTNEGVAGKLRTERLLLSLMLEYPGFIPRIIKDISGLHFSDESFRTIFELIMTESKKEKFSVGRLLDVLGDDELVDTVHSMSVSDDAGDENASDVLEDCVKYLVKCRLTERLRVITEEIKVAEESKDEDRVLKLITEKNALVSQGL
jgi:DNA primase